MLRTLSKSVLLLAYLVGIVCVLYPLSLWIVGQLFFSFQANGSILRDESGKAIGSALIAQPFSKDEYFHPRPSAASYDAAASASSALAASNYALRDRIARSLGPIVKDQQGKLIGPEVEAWFQKDRFQGKAGIVAQWASLHPSLAQAWVSADASHAATVAQWAKSHPGVKAADLALVFFQNFSKENPGKFPLTQGREIQALFFDLWRQDHPDVLLQEVPADMVTTSGSGLDPHISLQNAEFQLDRVATKWAADLKRKPEELKGEIEALLQQNTHAPLGGLLGEKFINVLEMNLALRKKYGA